MKEVKIPPVSRQFELRVEQTLARISEREERNMQKRHKRTVIIAVALVLVAATAALAASGGYIMDLFGTERRGRSELTQQLAGAVQPFAGNIFEGEYVRVTPGELLMTGDSFAATWTVENLTDEFLWIDAPVGFELNGISLFELGASSGIQDFEYYIDPGEVIESGVRTNLTAGAPEGESIFSHSLSVYRSKSGEKLMQDGRGAERDAHFDDLELVEKTFLTAPVICTELEMKSALPEGQPLSFEFEDYTLVIEKVQLSPALLTLKYKRIYPDAAALERTPLADYHVTDLKGDDAWWYSMAGSRTGDLNMEQSDGSFIHEWEEEYTVTSLPEGIRMRPYSDGNDAKADAEAVELVFE